MDAGGLSERKLRSAKGADDGARQAGALRRVLSLRHDRAERQEQAGGGETVERVT